MENLESKKETVENVLTKECEKKSDFDCPPSLLKVSAVFSQYKSPLYWIKGRESDLAPRTILNLFSLDILLLWSNSAEFTVEFISISKGLSSEVDVPPNQIVLVPPDLPVVVRNNSNSQNSIKQFFFAERFVRSCLSFDPGYSKPSTPLWGKARKDFMVLLNEFDFQLRKKKVRESSELASCFLERCFDLEESLMLPISPKTEREKKVSISHFNYLKAAELIRFSLEDLQSKEEFNSHLPKISSNSELISAFWEIWGMAPISYAKELESIWGAVSAKE